MERGLGLVGLSVKLECPTRPERVAAHNEILGVDLKAHLVAFIEPVPYLSNGWPFFTELLTSAFERLESAVLEQLDRRLGHAHDAELRQSPEHLRVELSIRRDQLIFRGEELRK